MSRVAQHERRRAALALELERRPDREVALDQVGLRAHLRLLAHGEGAGRSCAEMRRLATLACKRKFDEKKCEV